MKTIRTISILILPALLALTACTDADDMLDTSGQSEDAVHITATIAGETTTRIALNNDGSGTFATGDTWGMYTLKADGTVINDNLAFAYGTTTLYWKDLGATGKVTFSAHYPRWSRFSDPTESLYDLLSGPDLLFATATAGRGEKVKLNFKHLMHRLVVNLTKDADVEGELKDAYITIDSKQEVKVNLLEGTVDPNFSSIRKFAHGDIGAKADRIVAPLDLVVGAKWITITLAKKTYIYNVPANLKPDPSDPHPTRLESGKMLTLNLTLKKNTQVVLTSSDISGWTTEEQSAAAIINIAKGDS